MVIINSLAYYASLLIHCDLGAFVTKKKKHPAFTVDQFFGEEEHDIVRVVIEVASHDAKAPEVLAQLEEFMDAVGDRWERRLLGVAMLNGEVAMLERNISHNAGAVVGLKWRRTGSSVGDTYAVDPEDATWMKMNDKRFIAKLNEIRDHSFDYV